MKSVVDINPHIQANIDGEHAALHKQELTNPDKYPEYS